MPGAGYVQAAADGGPLKGGAPRVVWQSLGTDPRLVSAMSAAQRLNQLGRPSHLVWNPLNGEIVQLLPILRAARSLCCPEGLEQTAPPSPQEAGTTGDTAAHAAARADGGIAEVNAEGRLCVQICVVAFAWQPFTAGPMTGRQAIVGWLDSWNIPRQWPAGSPAPFPYGHASAGSRRLWARGGHFGASQLPGWMAAGPGAIDVELLTGQASSGPAELPPASPGSGNRRPSAAALPDLDRIFATGPPAAATLSGVG
jgi:hypothetical protein